MDESFQIRKCRTILCYRSFLVALLVQAI